MPKPIEIRGPINFSLSAPMRGALARALGTPLYQQRHGYAPASDGLDGISSATVEGLVKRGLAIVVSSHLRGRRCRRADLTRRGRRVARALSVGSKRNAGNG